MSLILPASDIAETLFIIFIVLVIGGIFVLMTYGAILEIKYTGPYTIVRTDSKEKWRRSVILALLKTGMLPITALLELVFIPFIPYADQVIFQSIFCGGIWIVVFPIAILYQRWDFERKINQYQKMDNKIKEERAAGKHSSISRLPKFAQLFMTSELQRFTSEGYPEQNKEGGLFTQ